MAEALQAQPPKRPGSYGLATAARCNNGCRRDGSDAKQAQAAGKDAGAWQSQSSQTQLAASSRIRLLATQCFR
jgi:hypothetical protein